MRFLADENFPRVAVLALRQAGYVVEWALELSSGGPDDAILARATATGAVILTFDKDFGELACHVSVSEGFGVVLFRIPISAADAGAALAQTLKSRSDWAGHFSVVEPGRVRMRPLTGV